MTYPKVLDCLGDPTRREVFERLRSGPLSVGEIARDMPVSRPAVSQHLASLKEAGLVVDRPVGTRRVYYIDPRGLGALRAWLDQFWAEALDAFKAEAEKDDPNSPRGGGARPSAAPARESPRKTQPLNKEQKK